MATARILVVEDGRLAEGLVDEGHGFDAIPAVLEGGAQPGVGEATGLEREQADDDLEVVFDAVVNLFEEDLLLVERSLQLHLRLLARGDVLPRAEHPEGMTGFIDHHRPTRLQYPHRPIRTDDTVLTGIGLVLSIRPFDQGGKALPILGMDELKDRLIRGSKLLPIHTPDPKQFIRPRHGICGDVPLPAAQLREMLGLRQLRLALLEIFLRLLTLDR